MDDRTAPDSLDLRAASTGQALAAADWPDTHFAACRPEYEAQLRAVGIQPGWRVLDAGCGVGSFLPWLGELVGPAGHLAALDLAPENVGLVERRAASWGLPCPLEVTGGTLLALPYPDASFDAAWCANTLQYLADDELAAALAELRRVVRPGGLVAVKDADISLTRILPGPPGLVLRTFAAWAATGSVQARGCLRSAELRLWLRRAGLAGVWGRVTLIERAAELDPLAPRHYREVLSVVAGLAASLDLTADDAAFWTRLRDPEVLDQFLDDPGFYGSEGNIFVVCSVPAA